jgi:hypothetical protein
MCEEKFVEFDKPKGEQDEKVWRPLMPSWRVFYNVYDYNNPDKGIHPFEISYAHFEDALLQAIELDDDELLLPWDPDDGKIIEFKAKEETWQGYQYNKPMEGSFNFAERDEPYTDEDMEEAFSFDGYLYIPKYDELAKAYYGVEDLGEVGRDSTPEREEEEEAESPRERRKARGRGRSRREPEEEKPRSRSRGRDRKQEDEEPPPEEDEEQEPPRSRRQRRSKKDELENECPAGGEFGTDCNELDECPDCPDDIFDRCVDLQDQMRQAEEKEEKKKAPPKKTRAKRGGAKKEDKAKSKRRPRRTR